MTCGFHHNYCKQAIAQVCAFYSLKTGSMNDMEMLQESLPHGRLRPAPHTGRLALRLIVTDPCGSSKLHRRVFDAGGASLEGSALHGVVFDRYARPQKRAGEARLPGSGRESPSDPDSEGVW